jgi:hypothetical protein
MISRSNVVLPVPLGPMTAVMAARRARIFRPLKMLLPAIA